MASGGTDLLVKRTGSPMTNEGRATVFIPAGLNPARHLGDILSLKPLCSTAVLFCSEEAKLANQVLDEFEGIQILSESEEIQIDGLELNENLIFLFGSSTRKSQYKLFHDIQRKYRQEIRIFSKIRKNSQRGGITDQVIIEVGKKFQFDQVRLSVEDGWKVLPNTLKDTVYLRDEIMAIETSCSGFDTGDDFAHVKFLPHLYQWEMTILWPEGDRSGSRWYRRWADEGLELVKRWKEVLGAPSILVNCQEIRLPEGDLKATIVERFKQARIKVKGA